MRSRKLPDKAFAPKEAAIEQACTQLLEYDGWRSLITDPKWLRGLGVQEKGMADRLYIRYWGDPRAPTLAEFIWIEFKRPGGKAAEHQKTWIYAERARGALVWLAGETFPPTYDGFLAYYRESGLNRRLT